MRNYESIPSIMAEHGKSTLSDRYSFVPTVKAIKLIEQNGWRVSNARETNARANKGFQKHMVRFRQDDDFGRRLEVNEIIPEIILTNAHDGTTRFEVMSGFERCWCSNQCTVSESTMKSHKITHIGYTDDKILNAVNDIVESTPKVMNSIDVFKDIKLNETERWIYAEMALDIMFKNNKWDNYSRAHTLNNLIKPTRIEDEEPTLWNLFNIVQERFIKGGRYLVHNESVANVKKQNLPDCYIDAVKVRKVKSIDRDIQINRDLWELTEQYRNVKELI